jgi:hypothetical protein
MDGKADKKRVKVIRARVSERDQDALAGFAASIELSESEALRRLIGAANGDGPVLCAADRAEFSQIAEEFRAIGVNINQAVRAMNTGRVPDMAAFRLDICDLASGMMAISEMLVQMGARSRSRVRRRVAEDMALVQSVR